MKKIFVISWFFVPINAAEAIVTYKLLKKSKYKYDVFTNQINDKFAFKPDKKLISDNINVIPCESLNSKLWIKKGYDYFKSNMDSYSCIMSRCMPRESHEVALKIKKRFKKVKWIASFSDPLAYSPYTKLIEEKNPYVNLPKNAKTILKNFIWNLRRLRYRLFSDPEIINRKIQKNTLKYADVLIFNNEYEKEFFLSKYKNLKIEDKIYIISHSYDLDLYDEIKKQNNNKITLAFLGHLDSFRNAHNFLEALYKLKCEKPDLANKLLINFYGNIDTKDKLFIIDHNLYDIIKINEPVTYLESLKIMKSNDYLLAIDADLSQYIDKNIFFASKIVDYIGSGSNILCITMDDSAVIKTLNDYGAYISNFEINNIYDMLLKSINSKSKKKNKKLEYLDNDYVSKEFDKIIDKLQ